VVRFGRERGGEGGLPWLRLRVEKLKMIYRVGMAEWRREMDAGIADVEDRNVAEDWRGFGLEMASAISRSVLSRTRINTAPDPVLPDNRTVS